MRAFVAQAGGSTGWTAARSLPNRAEILIEPIEALTHCFPVGKYIVSRVVNHVLFVFGRRAEVFEKRTLTRVVRERGIVAAVHHKHGLGHVGHEVEGVRLRWVGTQR